MSPETNVEYATSASFPVLHTEYLDFFPGQVPGKSMVIYESRKSVLGGYAPECIFVRNPSPELSVLYVSSEHSQGKLLSGPEDKNGYYFWVNQYGQEVSVSKSCYQEGRGFQRALWVVKEDKLINPFPNRYFEGGRFMSSRTGIAVIPVISEYPDHSGLVFCDQSNLAKPAVQNFLEEILGGKTRLPLDKIQIDIPVLAEAGKV